MKAEKYGEQIPRSRGAEKEMECGESMEAAGTVTGECEGVCGLREGIPVIFDCGDLAKESPPGSAGIIWQEPESDCFLIMSPHAGGLW